MKRLVEYEIVDRNGRRLGPFRGKREAVATAKRWDREVPEEAPHHVWKLTRERIHPPP